jgi:CRISPR system Cascade subunit CasB
MSEYSKKFVEYIMQTVNTSKAIQVALKRANNPNTEYQSWEILAGFGINIDYENERLSYATIASSIAHTCQSVNGNTSIAKAIGMCYQDGNQSHPAKTKLRRMLSCDSTSEICRILRPLFSLINSKGIVSLDYVKLLDQLRWYDNEDSRQRTKISWAQDFYGKAVRGEIND